jgi:hypothetical protein
MEPFLPLADYGLFIYLDTKENKVTYFSPISLK